MKRNNTAVVRFRPGKLEGILKTINSSYQFSGESVSLVQAYLIWLPFSLPAAALVSFAILCMSCDNHVILHESHVTLPCALYRRKSLREWTSSQLIDSKTMRYVIFHKAYLQSGLNN